MWNISALRDGGSTYPYGHLRSIPTHHPFPLRECFCRTSVSQWFLCSKISCTVSTPSLTVTANSSLPSKTKKLKFNSASTNMKTLSNILDEHQLDNRLFILITFFLASHYLRSVLFLTTCHHNNLQPFDVQILCNPSLFHIILDANLMLCILNHSWWN